MLFYYNDGTQTVKKYRAINFHLNHIIAIVSVFILAALKLSLSLEYFSANAILQPVFRIRLKKRRRYQRVTVVHLLLHLVGFCRVAVQNRQFSARYSPYGGISLLRNNWIGTIRECTLSSSLSLRFFWSFFVPLIQPGSEQRDTSAPYPNGVGRFLFRMCWLSNVNKI